jgi:hypothetical protein
MQLTTSPSAPSCSSWPSTVWLAKLALVAVEYVAAEVVAALAAVELADDRPAVERVVALVQAVHRLGDAAICAIALLLPRSGRLPRAFGYPSGRRQPEPRIGDASSWSVYWTMIVVVMSEFTVPSVWILIVCVPGASGSRSTTQP